MKRAVTTFAEAAVDRPVLFTPRADVLAMLAAASPLAGCVVADPLTREHYEFSPEEHTLLTHLRPSVSGRDLQRTLERAFAPRRFPPAAVAAYLARLHEAGLIMADGAGQGEALAQRAAERAALERRWSWTKLLSLRIPLVNPHRALGLLSGVGRIVFSPLGAIAFGVLALFALGVLGSNFSRLVEELPGLAELRQPTLWLRWLLTLAVVKSLHELGHALACQRHGGAVTEMGLLLLLGAPCLYTDVSDAWRFPRGARMLTSAAGVLVELAIAALALLVWRATAAGWLHTTALEVATIASLGTLLVNANPLLRYDGYYLLSDATATTNLWSRSRAAVADRLARPFTRRESELAEPAWLAGYGLASMAYLTLVMGTLVWLLYAALKPQRLEILALGVGTLVLASMVAPPISRFGRTLGSPLARRRWRWPRIAVGLALLGALLWVGAQLPWQQRVPAQAYTVAHAAETVVVTLPGRIAEALPVGARVKKGEIILRLENLDLAREQLQLTERIAQQRLKLEHLQKLRSVDPQLADQLPHEQAALASLTQQARELAAETGRLTLRAPRAGMLLAPASRPAERNEATLPTWSGAPLDPQNAGAWLTPGVEVCAVGDPQEVAVELAINDADSDRVRIGQPVKLALAQRPGEVFAGRIVELSGRATPRNAAEKTSPTAPWFARNSVLPTGAAYLARAEFTESPPPLALASLGQARILTGESTIGAELWRMIGQALRVW